MQRVTTGWLAIALSVGFVVIGGSTLGLLSMLPSEVGPGALWEAPDPLVQWLVISMIAGGGLGATLGAFALVQSVRGLRSGGWPTSLLGAAMLLCALSGLGFGTLVPSLVLLLLVRSAGGAPPDEALLAVTLGCLTCWGLAGGWYAVVSAIRRSAARDVDR